MNGDSEPRKQFPIWDQTGAEDYVRIRREHLGGFREAGHGRLIASGETAKQTSSPLIRLARRARVFVTGRPLDTEALETERLSVRLALPILSSDALSSVAYGPEAGLAVLAAAGAGALILNVPIGIAIAVLMVIVTISYRQVVRGYQRGGGSYAVARANLGLVFGLIAAAALLVDYVLTVAVSVSSGVAALTSAFAGLSPYRVPIALTIVALLTVGNLHGVRTAAAIFAGPTYLFIASLLALIVTGLVRGLLVGHHPVGQYAPISPETALGPLLVLTAFASGASSMTGIEAISNSVPSFERPEARHAARTLTVLGVLLVSLFLGVVVLDVLYGAEPVRGGSPTVLSQIGTIVFQGPARPAYYAFQLTTLLVLLLAANTSFNGFPRLCALLARDHLLPLHFAHLGNRLVYSTGIILLALFAVALIVVFKGNTNALIDLYALGVFAAFTLAQLGMARHWWRHRGVGWRHGVIINACGAVVTGVVDGVIIMTKSPRGAWVILVVVPSLVALFWAVSRYYAGVASELFAIGSRESSLERGPALVPVFNLDHPARAALRYALALSPEVVAVHQARDPHGAARFREEWNALRWPAGARSPLLDLQVAGRRSRVGAFLAVLDGARKRSPGRVVTVVIPEEASPHLVRGVVTRPHVAHLKLSLLRRPDVVATSIPAGVAATASKGFPDGRQESEHVALVPVTDADAPARRALAYAATIASGVIAVHVETRVDEPDEPNREVTQRLVEWSRRQQTSPPRLIVIESPYRNVIPPLLAYIASWRREHPEPLCTVVLPELVVDRWWASWLHNHRAFWLKVGLLSYPTVATADVTYHLRARTQ